MAKKEYSKISQNEQVVLHEVEEVKTVTEKKELKSIVSVEPTKVKKGLLGRFVGGVLGPDGVSGIGEYVNEEIIKPAIKNIIVDAVTSGINMIMYGEKGGPNRGPRTHTRHSGYSNHTNYTSRYTSTNPPPASNQPQQRYAKVGGNGVDEYIIADRYDASHVLTALTENADMYGSVSVADYYDLIGVESKYTDNQYGWTIDNITRATIAPVRGGYIIRFPNVEVI